MNCYGRLSRYTALLIILSWYGLSAAAADETLSLRFEGRVAVVEGVTPGGTLVLFAKARRQNLVHDAESFGLHFMIPDRSGTGRVRLDLGRELPQDAVWALVDFTTGRHVIIPLGAAAERRPLPYGTLKALAAEQAGKLSLVLPVADVLVVRPGENAWFGVIGDGGTADEDAHPNGRSVFSPRSLKNLQSKSAKTLEGIRKRDVVVIIDPVTLQSWSSIEVGE